MSSSSWSDMDVLVLSALSICCMGSGEGGRSADESRAGCRSFLIVRGDVIWT